LIQYGKIYPISLKLDPLNIVSLGLHDTYERFTAATKEIEIFIFRFHLVLIFGLEGLFSLGARVSKPSNIPGAFIVEWPIEGVSYVGFTIFVVCMTFRLVLSLALKCFLV
jgi:hypothetical protein